MQTCTPCHGSSTANPPLPSACATCHGGASAILASTTHALPTTGCGHHRWLPRRPEPDADAYGDRHDHADADAYGDRHDHPDADAYGDRHGHSDADPQPQRH